MLQYVFNKLRLLSSTLICILKHEKMRIWHPRNYGLSLGILVISFLQSCSNSNYRETQTLSAQERSVANPPSMVEKLWLARTHYDQDRRLIVPKVGGSRWGAVQEYTADGNLVYRDWWVRNLKVEDLEAAPSTGNSGCTRRGH